MTRTTILLLFTLLLSACSSLNDNLIAHATSKNQPSSTTVILALSNIALSQAEIDKVVQIYAMETNNVKKLYLSYLLAQRTQQQNYIDAFVMHCAATPNLLLTKNSKWISIVTPPLKSLANYALTNDKALKTLLQLTEKSDGANLAYIASQLKLANSYNEERVRNIANQLSLSLAEIITEDE